MEAAVQHKGLSSVFCDEFEGETWEGDSRQRGYRVSVQFSPVAQGRVQLVTP